MKITKLGHCCLIIETRGKRIMTDPGSYTILKHSEVANLDALIFTHEHSDHYDLPSLRKIISNNSSIKIYTNTSVGLLLEQEKITHEKLVDGQEIKIGDVLVKAYGEKHAMMHSEIPLSGNTGIMIDDKLFYPGDAFTNPKRDVEILAVPCAGPWMKISEAVDYAIEINPKIAIPVHDGMRIGSAHRIPGIVLPKHGIEFIPMVEGDEKEF